MSESEIAKLVAEASEAEWPPFGSITLMTDAEKRLYNEAVDAQINMLLEACGISPIEFAGHRGTYSDPKCALCHPEGVKV